MLQSLLIALIVGTGFALAGAALGAAFNPQRGGR